MLFSSLAAEKKLM